MTDVKTSSAEKEEEVIVNSWLLKYPKVIERTATMRADTDIVAIIRLTFEWI